MIFKNRQVQIVLQLLSIAVVMMPYFVKADESSLASPIYGVTIPDGYRKWELVGTSMEAAPLDELRVILGNEKAIKAYKDKILPFPEGAIVVKLAWKKMQSPEFQTATIPGADRKSVV